MLNLVLPRPFGLHHDGVTLAELDANDESTRGTELDLNHTIGAIQE